MARQEAPGGVGERHSAGAVRWRQEGGERRSEAGGRREEEGRRRRKAGEKGEGRGEE